MDAEHVEPAEMTAAEADWHYWATSQKADTGGRCTCGHEGLGVDWHESGCPGAGYALRQKVKAQFAELVTAWDRVADLLETPPGRE